MLASLPRVLCAVSYLPPPPRGRLRLRAGRAYSTGHVLGGRPTSSLLSTVNSSVRCAVLNVLSLFQNGPATAQGSRAHLKDTRCDHQVSTSLSPSSKPMTVWVLCPIKVHDWYQADECVMMWDALPSTQRDSRHCGSTQKQEHSVI